MLWRSRLYSPTARFASVSSRRVVLASITFSLVGVAHVALHEAKEWNAQARAIHQSACAVPSFDHTVIPRSNEIGQPVPKYRYRLLDNICYDVHYT